MNFFSISIICKWLYVYCYDKLTHVISASASFKYKLLRDDYNIVATKTQYSRFFLPNLRIQAQLGSHRPTQNALMYLIYKFDFWKNNLVQFVCVCGKGNIKGVALEQNQQNDLVILK